MTKNNSDSSLPHSHNRHGHSFSKHSNAVVFAPDLGETGTQVVNCACQSFGLFNCFPPNCIVLVKHVAQQDHTKGLKNCTDKPHITIDNKNLNDLDQARWITSADQKKNLGFQMMAHWVVKEKIKPLWSDAA